MCFQYKSDNTPWNSQNIHDNYKASSMFLILSTWTVHGQKEYAIILASYQIQQMLGIDLGQKC